MNLTKVKRIIELYKLDFARIHTAEIYKWKAVKFFQDNWDINAPDFAKMLLISIREARNLLDSGQYFPRRMLTQYVMKRPQKIKNLFQELYNEDLDLTSRIASFQNGIEELSQTLLPGKNPYQDQRAILVYLCLRYPDRYFLYKYEMFKSFSKKIDCSYVPKRGGSENIIQYLTLANLVREEIIRDNFLIKLHQERLGNEHFYDSSLNILTQDVIYAAVRHIDLTQFDTEPVIVDIELVKDAFKPSEVASVLKGRFVNYIDNDRENKRIGDLGELAILEYESKVLTQKNIHNFELLHKSKNEGDGLGYDILSQTADGKPKYIEVKTTKYAVDKPFFITKNELMKSIEEKNNFYLYRLFAFDEVTKKGKLLIIKGDLTKFCISPTIYKVKLIGA